MEAWPVLLTVAAAALAGLALAQPFEPGPGPWRRLAAAGAVLPALIVAPGGADAAFLAWTALLVTLLVALAAIDLASRTVPDLLSLPLIAFGLVHAWARGLAAPALLALVVALVLAAWLVPGRWRRGVGGGDVLLAAGALAWLGPGVAIDLAVLVSVFLLPLAAWARARPGGAGIPAAPAVAAAVATLWFGGPVL
jgi:leader peptidase (prepilin peptidase)/N-methyltransferase